MAETECTEEDCLQQKKMPWCVNTAWTPFPRDEDDDDVDGVEWIVYGGLCFFPFLSAHFLWLFVFFCCFCLLFIYVSFNLFHYLWQSGIYSDVSQHKGTAPIIICTDFNVIIFIVQYLYGQVSPLKNVIIIIIIIIKKTNNEDYRTFSSVYHNDTVVTVATY